MISIVVFENDKQFATWLEQEIRTFTHHPSSVNTGNAKEIQKFIQQPHKNVLYFLDIVDESNGYQTTGLDLAKEIAASKQNALIVFISAFLEHIWYDTEIKASSFLFIEKNPQYLKQEIEKTIDLAHRYFEHEALHVSGKLEDIHVPYREICLIESIPHVQGKIRIKGLYGSYILRSSIREIQEELDSRFVKVHQSYIVNKENVRSVNKAEHKIYLVDGSYCFYARRYQKIVTTLLSDD